MTNKNFSTFSGINILKKFKFINNITLYPKGEVKEKVDRDYWDDASVCGVRENMVKNRGRDGGKECEELTPHVWDRAENKKRLSTFVI